MNRLVAVVFSVALFGACSPIVDAEFSEVEVTCPGIQIPAAPSAGKATVNFTFSLNSKNLGANTNLAAQNQIDAIELRESSITADFTNLAFIDTLHAVAFVPIKGSNKTPGGPVIEIADYVHRPGKSVGKVLTLPPPAPVDVRPLLRPDANQQAVIVVVVNLTGDLPTTTWTAEVDMLLSMRVQP